MPCIPTPNKWAKLYASIDFLAVGTLLFNFLPTIFNEAFKGFTFEEFNTAAMDADPSLIEGLHFHQVRGKRFQASQLFLNSKEQMTDVIIVMLVSEFLRTIQFFWLSCLDRVRHTPGIHQALRPSESPIFQATQDISRLLHSPGTGRLLFIWKRLEYSSWDA